MICSLATKSSLGALCRLKSRKQTECSYESYKMLHQPLYLIVIIIILLLNCYIVTFVLGQLKTLLADIRKCSNEKSVAKEDELQELITYVQFANDECDYGMGLELGMDLFCFGTGFEDKAANLLSMAYSLLARDEFATIAEVHSKNRSRPSLSQLEV